MHRLLNVSGGLTALAFITSFSTVTALAQHPSSNDSITFSKSVAQAPQQSGSQAAKPASGVALKPIAPPPSVVLDASAEPAGGIAMIVPPAPKIAARGAVVLPRPTGSYSSKLAAASSGLKVNSNYGWRRDPFTKRGRRHTGVDIDGEWGESVGASMAGTVSFSGVKRGYGNIVILDHGNGLSTYYAHLSSMAVTVGDGVVAGQVIGYIGSTGRSSGPHLHYELRAFGQPVNPYATIAIDGRNVFVDGRPVQTSRVVEGWGDEPEPAANTRAGAKTERPRRAVKPVLVFSEDSLTEY